MSASQPDPGAPTQPAHPAAKSAPKPRAKRPSRAKPKEPYRYPSNLRFSTVRFGRCHRCRIQGLTCTYDALPLHCDAQPLTLTGEIQALIAGHTTWLLSAGHMWKRTSWAITTSPRGTGGLVLRNHICQRGQPRPEHVNWPRPSDTTPGF
jgi:hypothetical protein